jgi:hypothetical protein
MFNCFRDEGPEFKPDLEGRVIKPELDVENSRSDLFYLLFLSQLLDTAEGRRF